MGEAELECLLGSALAGGGAEFAEDGGHVVLDCPHRNEQARRDLLVGLAVGKEIENLLFTCGQASWVCSGCHTGTGGNGVHAKVSHPLAYQASRRLGTKINKSRQGLPQVGLVVGVQER